MAFIVVFIITVAIWVALIQALDRSIFPGCRVISQNNKQLVIRLDRDLCDGTDESCEFAEALIKKIRKSGYDPYILISQDEWCPSVAPFVYDPS